MDKYEFNIKIEQIKKMVARSDYETAMKIADTIDWRRVRNINILSMAATIYEKNEEYQEAKDILLLAFERAPIGKRLLYKLAELAIKEGSLREAEDYYKEFCDLAPDDPRQYILRYLILGAKGAPAGQLIHTLEQYCNLELDEKWLYELAELYSEAGQDDLCIMACDKIMLMFGLGKYVDKAMELKIQLAPLTKYQMDLVENRDKYEAKLKAVEQEYRMGSPVEYEEEGSGADPYGYQDAPYDGLQEAAFTREPPEETGEEIYEEEYPQEYQDQYSGGYEDEYQEGSREEYRYQDEYDERYQGPYEEVGERRKPSRLTIVPEEPEERLEPESSAWSGPGPVSPPEETDEALKARIHEAEVQASLAMEMSRLSSGSGYHEEVEMAQTRVLTDIRDIKRGTPAPESRRLMIEAETPEQGLKEAVEALKQIHKETGAKNQAAKITGERLNLKGVFAVADKLTGKDLIVEHAGVMMESAVQELNQLIARDETGINVVLIDTADHLKELYQVYPGFAKQFERAKDKETAPDVIEDEPEEDHRPVRHIEIKRETAGTPIPLRKENGIQDKGIKRHESAVNRKAPQVSGERSLSQSEAERIITQPGAGRVVSQLVGGKPVAEVSPSSLSAREPVSRPKPAPVPRQEQGSRYKAEAESTAQSRPAPVRPKKVENPANGAPAYKMYPKDLPKTEISSEPEEPEYEEVQEEMDIDEFAKYACKYAGEIDCSISGKSMLALYERIEIMEEDGIPLTTANAEELIEEAADRAENPSFFKRLTGVFSSKYDKEGLLILKEEHFI